MEKEIKRSKYWPFIVELLEKYFPKHQCKERGRALVLISEIEKMLQEDIKIKRYTKGPNPVKGELWREKSKN